MVSLPSPQALLPTRKECRQVEALGIDLPAAFYPSKGLGEGV